MRTILSRLLKNPATWVFLLIYCTYLAMFLLTPLQNDDLTFICKWKVECGGTDEFSINTYSRFIQHNRLSDNSRISNILFPLFGMFSPWKEIFPFLAAGVICGIFWFINRFSLALRSSFAITAIWFVMVLFFPWRAHVFEVDYALNYLFSSFITLLTVFLLLRYENEGWKLESVMIVGLCAFLAGGWHEGFAVPTLCGLGMITLVKRFRMSWQWYLLIVIYLISTVLFGFSLGMVSRFNREVGAEPINIIYAASNLSMCIIVIASVVGFLLIGAGRRQLRRCFRSDYFIIALIGMIAGMGISLKVIHNTQSACYPELLAVICFFSLYKKVLEKIGDKAKAGLTVILLFLLFIQSGSTLYWDYKFFNQDQEIQTKLRQSPTGTVFHDLIMPWEVPAIPTLYFPSRLGYSFAIQINVIDRVWPDKTFAVIPKALQHVDMSQAAPLGGGFYKYNGYILSTEISPAKRAGYADLQLPDGTTLNYIYLLFQDFQTVDGETYTYVQPMHPDGNRAESVTFRSICE